MVCMGQNFAQAVDSKGRVIDAQGDVYINGTKLGSVTMDITNKNIKSTTKLSYIHELAVIVATLHERNV